MVNIFKSNIYFHIEFQLFLFPPIPKDTIFGKTRREHVLCHRGWLDRRHRGWLNLHARFLCLIVGVFNIHNKYMRFKEISSFGRCWWDFRCGDTIEAVWDLCNGGPCVVISGYTYRFWSTFATFGAPLYRFVSWRAEHLFIYIYGLFEWLLYMYFTFLHTFALHCFHCV